MTTALWRLPGATAVNRAPAHEPTEEKPIEYLVERKNIGKDFPE